MNSEYSAIAAKLKAMHARFLTEKDYEELLSKKNVTDICAYLKSTEGYSDTLAEVNERDIHRGVMELILERDIMDEYIRLYNFVDKDKRDLLEYWFMGREIDFLKREIGYIYTHEKRSADEVNQGRFDAFFETHTKINREIMGKAHSLSDCIAAAADTPYGKILQRAENIDADLFAIGMMLDTYRYTALWREAGKKLCANQLSIFKGLIGSKIDMLNLMWIYRGKRYYEHNSEIIFAYILPIRYRLRDEIFAELVKSKSVDTFVDIVRNKTPYGELFENWERSTFPEENYRYIYNKLAKRVFVNHSESLAAIPAYLALKEFELNNITTITEGVRYALNPQSIREHIGDII